MCISLRKGEVVIVAICWEGNFKFLDSDFAKSRLEFHWDKSDFCSVCGKRQKRN